MISNMKALQTPFSEVILPEPVKHMQAAIYRRSLSKYAGSEQQENSRDQLRRSSILTKRAILKMFS